MKDKIHRTNGGMENFLAPADGSLIRTSVWYPVPARRHRRPPERLKKPPKNLPCQIVFSMMTFLSIINLYIHIRYSTTKLSISLIFDLVTFKLVLLV